MQGELEKNIKIVNTQQSKTRMVQECKGKLLKPMRPYVSVRFVR